MHNPVVLAIYQARALAGVLDVLLSEAHAFEEGEVQTYQLMARQIEAAIFQAAPIEQKTNPIAQSPIIPQPTIGNRNNGGRMVRDRLCQVIRQHQLDLNLVKAPRGRLSGKCADPVPYRSWRSAPRGITAWRLDVEVRSSSLLVPTIS